MDKFVYKEDALIFVQLPYAQMEQSAKELNA